MTSDRKKRRAAKRTPEFPACRVFWDTCTDFRDEYGSAADGASVSKRRHTGSQGS